MRGTWIHREGGGHLTLFFGGWGMDERSVRHLTGGGDVLAFHDYRELPGEAPGVAGYHRVEVVAWSMGVWAASVSLTRWGIVPAAAVALNGTERPVDERHGIPPAIYALTERGMDARGWEKFLARALDGEGERAAFDAGRRPLDERVEELRRVREQAAVERPRIAWTRAFISRKDNIFPPGNQREWWQGRCPEVVYLDGGHYPFSRFSSWDSIIHP
jgi:biotin synthesis protein BioG